jgi:uncharacterized membrane protein YhaH (DUF805 family)
MSRREFWMFNLYLILAFFLICFLLGMIVAMANVSPDETQLYWIALIIAPSYISSRVRRLHDVGKSGWFLWLEIIPFAAFYILYLICKKGDVGANKYGEPTASGITRVML